MSQLTDLLTELDKAATPGPWHVGAMNDALFIIDQPPRHFTDNPLPPDGVTITIAAIAMLSMADANAALIVALRNHLPEILKALKEVRGDSIGRM